jgi:antitoxin (DNA-binding transcriptional repressor) of toxin-antitoxin stability system
MSESFWIHMNSLTVRELRTAFPKIEAMLLNGQEVAITKRGKIVALLVQPAKRKLDFNRRFGGAVQHDLSNTDVVGMLLELCHARVHNHHSN